MDTAEAFEAAVHRHDQQLAALGLDIWVGSEPTFTDRLAQTPEWLHQALGGDKAQRAERLLVALGRYFPGAVVLRSVGRQYPGEALPRWSLGLYRRRDGRPLWDGAPDPLLASTDAPVPPDLDAWTESLAAALCSSGVWVAQVPSDEPQERRLVTAAVPLSDLSDPRLRAPSVHAQAIPAGGLRDVLAEEGIHLFVLSLKSLGERAVARLELPAYNCVSGFLVLLELLGQVSRAAGLNELILAGYPPPVDASVEWTTVTPDPAVIEINTAPSRNATDFLRRSRAVYAAALAEGLAPYRLYYNGMVADSGGGGQITLGGPAPQTSPFLLEPRLLPRLVCFFTRHPALSYLYAHDHVGSHGQSVRADERGTDALDELALSLSLLERTDPLSADLLWHSLAPFLCDAAGNSHRAEINIEKLWNPYLTGRGRQGLVEFRALRMQHTPERATALACLLRAIVAMLCQRPNHPAMVDWGRALHDRFALPFYLQRDLEAVLTALEDAGLGLEEPIKRVLLVDEFRAWGEVALPGCRLEVRRALEFWPLLGDAASPEQGGGSRLVDASCARVELRLRPGDDGGPDWEGWQINYIPGSGQAPESHSAWVGAVSGRPDARQDKGMHVTLPMRPEHDALGSLKVYGLRYRSFVPAWGLHPALGVQVPVRLILRHPDLRPCYEVSLHEWRPDGEAYAGLPVDLAEAAARRSARITLRCVPVDGMTTAASSDVAGLGPYFLDLRRLSG